MQLFMLGVMGVGVSLLPVFLAERWCRQHQIKKMLLVPWGIAWLERTAVWIFYRLPDSIRKSSRMTGYARETAGKLYPGLKREDFARQYAVRKLMILYGGWMLACAVFTGYAYLNQAPVLSQNDLPRADAGGQSREVQVEAVIEGIEDEQAMTVTVEPRKYSPAEQERLIQEVENYIDASLPGANPDLEHVNQSLIFPTVFPGENVVIEWQPEDYNLIRQDGSLGDLSDYQLPVRTKVTAVIQYESEKTVYTKDIQIVEQVKTEREQLEAQVAAAVQQADQDSSEKLTFHLPDMVDGHAIQWQYQYQSQAGAVLLLALIGMIVVMFYQDNQLKKKLEIRSEQLLYAYPGFVHRMMLMLGAGMTVRRSWYQLLEDFEKHDQKQLKEDWLYREMRYTHLQMQSGVPEMQAYLEFGQRIQLQPYMKFSQLLIQYIKRGSRGMQALMQQEALEAEKQRRDLARRLGETAGTKLLMPMMLLLVIVLLIVMVPALMSM